MKNDYRVHKNPPLDIVLTDQSSSQSHTQILICILTLISCLCLGHSCDLFPAEFSTNILHKFITSPMRVTCTSNLKPLDFIVLIIFGELYKLKTSSCYILSLRYKYSQHPVIILHTHTLYHFFKTKSHLSTGFIKFPNTSAPGL